jgi:hypothetical protein
VKTDLSNSAFSNRDPSSNLLLPGSQFTWSDNQFISQENYEGQHFNGRLGITQSPRIEENLTPDLPEDRIFKGWELKPHEFPWMVKLKVCPIWKPAFFVCNNIFSIYNNLGLIY